ncbi:MAG: hypothetical protein ACJ788_03930 [Ktedonobacteraceae bacterium]
MGQDIDFVGVNGFTPALVSGFTPALVSGLMSAQPTANRRAFPWRLVAPAPSRAGIKPAPTASFAVLCILFCSVTYLTCIAPCGRPGPLRLPRH